MCAPAPRRALRLAYALAAATLLATLPTLVRAARAAHWTLRAQACLTAGVFVGLALPVSFYEVAMQLAFFARPRLQIRVIRILWMVPVYALNSWFALRFAVRGRRGRERRVDGRRERKEKAPTQHSLAHSLSPLPSPPASTWTRYGSATRPMSSTTSSCTCAPTWRTR